MNLRNHMSSTRWGDIVCVLLFFATFYQSYQVVTEWLTNEPFAYAMLFVAVIYAIIAFARLALLQKKRVLRDWVYAVYSILFVLITTFYMLSTMPGYDVVKGWRIASSLSSMTLYFVVGSGIVRLVVRIVKKRKKKALG